MRGSYCTVSKEDSCSVKLPEGLLVPVVNTEIELSLITNDNKMKFITITKLITSLYDKIFTNDQLCDDIYTILSVRLKKNTFFSKEYLNKLRTAKKLNMKLIDENFKKINNNFNGKSFNDKIRSYISLSNDEIDIIARLLQYDMKTTYRELNDKNILILTNKIGQDIKPRKKLKDEYSYNIGGKIDRIRDWYNSNDRSYPTYDIVLNENNDYIDIFEQNVRVYFKNNYELINKEFSPKNNENDMMYVVAEKSSEPNSGKKIVVHDINDKEYTVYEIPEKTTTKYYINYGDEWYKYELKYQGKADIYPAEKAIVTLKYLLCVDYINHIYINEEKTYKTPVEIFYYAYLVYVINIFANVSHIEPYNKALGNSMFYYDKNGKHYLHNQQQK